MFSKLKFSLLLMAFLFGFFQRFRGSRQGNLISLYLFELAMKVLNCLLKKAREGRLPIKI